MAAASLVVRRLGNVPFNALQLHGFHGRRLPLDFALEAFQEFALLNHHPVQLLELVFKVGDAGLQFFDVTVTVICHAASLPGRPRKVEPSR